MEKNKIDEDTIKSLESMVGRLLAKASRAARFNDTVSQNSNIDKAAKLQKRIKYLQNN